MDKKCKRKTDGEQLYLVYEAVEEIAMHIKLTEVEAGVWTLRREYFNALKSAGFGRLHVEKRHIAIEIILIKLKPYALYK